MADLPERQGTADFALACRKAPPFVPPSGYPARGESESERKPTLLFEFDRTLFKFNAQTPSMEPLFQLPPAMGAI